MSLLGKIFGVFVKFFAMIFRGRTGQVIAALKDVAKQIVLDLMASPLPGPERFRIALQRLKQTAVTMGVETFDHALRLLIELEVTEAKGDALEEIIDSGLEMARSIVEQINAGDLAGDDERRAAAILRLRVEFLKQGKEWLCSDHVLNLLVEAAVASFKNN